jgi:hypothetical protein
MLIFPIIEIIIFTLVNLNGTNYQSFLLNHRENYDEYSYCRMRFCC